MKMHAPDSTDYLERARSVADEVRQQFPVELTVGPALGILEAAIALADEARQSTLATQRILIELGGIRDAADRLTLLVDAMGRDRAPLARTPTGGVAVALEGMETTPRTGVQSGPGAPASPARRRWWWRWTQRR